MHWLLIIVAVIGAALYYAYHGHTRRGRDLGRLFDLAAAKRRGSVTPATSLALPQLHFEIDGRHFRVGALPTSGAEATGSGPFCFVDVALGVDTGQQLRLARRDVEATADAARRLGQPAPDGRSATGDHAFDTAFRMKWNNDDFAARLLDAGLRRKLLAARLPRLDIRLDGARLGVHTDGYVETLIDLDELIDIAATIAARCPGGRGGAT